MGVLGSGSVTTGVVGVVSGVLLILLDDPPPPPQAVNDRPSTHSTGHASGLKRLVMDVEWLVVSVFM